jgi:hypothetical protein
VDLGATPLVEIPHAPVEAEIGVSASVMEAASLLTLPPPRILWIFVTVQLVERAVELADVPDSPTINFLWLRCSPVGDHLVELLALMP